MTGGDAQQKLYAYAQQGFRVLVQIVPTVLWSGVKRALGGFFILGFVGTLLAGAIALVYHLLGQPLPWWMILVTVGGVSLCLSLAGAYVGGMRGLLGALAQQMAERQLLDYLYAFVRPVLARAAQDLATRSGPVTRSEMAKRLKRAAGERAKDALASEAGKRSLGEKLEHWVASKLQTILVAAAITPETTPRDREQAIAQLEATGIDKVEEALVDALEGLYNTQCIIVIAIAFVVSAIPYAVFALTA